MSDRTTQAMSTPPAPTVLGGRFELVTRLGEGGMATVYRALDRKTGEHCALKVLLSKYADRPSLRARFSAEAEAMSRIHHRNVIHVFEVGTNGPRPFFAMELAEGGCLIDWIEMHGPMPPRMALDVAIQICKGIGAAHRIGVIHRDIKPHNILVNRRGVCKITDFGIAQFDDDSASMTKTGSVMGTLGYIAPEQRANAKDVDERTDIYSIGATLYTMLTARTTMDLFFADQEPEMLEGVCEPLIPVILQSTRYRREDRYPTVRAMAKALYHLKATLPEDPPGTPSIVLTGEYVEGTVLRDQDTTFETYGARPTDPDDELSEISADVSHLIRKGPPSLPPGPPPGAGRQSLPPTPAASLPPSDSPTGLGQRTPTPVSLSRNSLVRQDRPRPMVDWGRVARHVVTISTPLLTAIFLAAGVAFYGGVAVAEAEHVALDAREALFDQLKKERALPDHLITVGADAELVSGAWARAQQGDGDERVAHIDTMLTVANRELSANAPTHAASDRFGRARDVQQAIGRITELHQAYLRERADWSEAAHTPQGAFAVWLGLAAAPPEGPTPP